MPNTRSTLEERKREDHLLDENLEISSVKFPGWATRLVSAFPAFKSRNYRLYFFGQFLSLLGTWFQSIAQGWLVLKLSNSAFQVGLVAAAASLPTLLFSLYGGVLVDRFPKLKTLFLTQAMAMCLAFILGTLTLLGIVTVPQIVVLAFLLGMINAVDMPCRQAFMVEIVDHKKDLTSAIALNSCMANVARVIGPTIAGLLIVTVGTAGAFLLNSASYLAIIMALSMMRLKAPRSDYHKTPIWPAIQQGVRYSWRHPILRTLIAMTAVCSVFGWSFTTLLPVIARDIFHFDAGGLGMLYAAFGLGAVVGAVGMSVYSDKMASIWTILGGNTLFAVGIIVFSLTVNLPLAFTALFVAGMGLLTQFSIINAMIQHNVPDEIRGRVMSIYLLAFIGLFPLGNLQVGFVAEHVGPEFAIRLGAVIVFVTGLIVFAIRHNIRVFTPIRIVSPGP